MPLSRHIATQPGIPKPGKPPQDLHRTTGNDHRRPHRTACAPHTHTRPTGCHHRALSPEWRPRGPKRAQDAPQAKLGPSTGQPQGAVATQGPTGRPSGDTGATTGPHRPEHRTTTGPHRTGHRTTTGPHRRPQDGAQGSTGAPTGPAQAVTGRATRHHRITHRGHQRPAQRTGDGATARKARGPKPHGGMAKRAPISPPEQSANRRLPVRVGGGRPVPHKQRRGVFPPVWPRPGPERPEALPEGVPRAGKVLRHRGFGGKLGYRRACAWGLVGCGLGVVLVGELGF